MGSEMCIRDRQKVLPYELVEDLINNNDTFAVIRCQCRYIGELSGNPCEIAPSDMGCFVTGIGAKSLTNMGLAKPLTKEEAIEYLIKTEKAGLVHITSNSKGGEHLMFICNCCPCHCGALLPAKKFGFKTVISSNFRPKINNELCVKCQTCIKKCPMNALTQNNEELISLNSDLCIGCGICASNCPKNAIKMVREEK